jgi:hypothetical protein
MLLLVGVSVGVLSPPCGMEFTAETSLPSRRRLGSKPTVWDGDAKSCNTVFSIYLRIHVLSPPCGMETPMVI